MNNYKAKSQLYQIYVCSEMNSVNISRIVIPKLDIDLSYDYESKLYKPSNSWGSTSKSRIEAVMESRYKKDLRPLYYEINHFKIEDNLIDLIKSKDEYNNRLASEILLLKLETIKL